MGIYNLAKWEDLLNKYLESPILKFWKSMLYQDVSQFLLRAKPVVLMTSYLTKDFVEEQENGCPIGQLYIQMYAVRGR